MRHLATLTLLISMLATTFSNCFIVFDYALNKKFIAANLCENRNRPALKCNGKCWLCKKLNKDNKNGTENPAQKGSFKFEVLSPLTTSPSLLSIYHSDTSPWHTFQELTYSAFVGSFFHPPQP